MNKFWQVHPTRMNLLSLVNRSAIKSLHLHTSVAASARSLSAAAHPGRFNVDLQAVNDDHSSKNKSLQFCSAPFVPTSSMASVQHFTSVTSNRKFSTSSSTSGQGQGQGEGRGEGSGEGRGEGRGKGAGGYNYGRRQEGIGLVVTGIVVYALEPLVPNYDLRRVMHALAYICAGVGILFIVLSII